MRGAGVALLLVGCAHKASSGTDYEPPGDCRFDLGGRWQKEDDVGLRYEATDDGKTLRLIPQRVNADGTPVGSDSSPQGIAIELRREHGELVGEFRMQVATEPGQSCPLLFRAKLDSCAADRLTLEIERTYDVNPACAPVDLGPIATSQQTLVRVK
jgi:hypothetical protein